MNRPLLYGALLLTVLVGASAKADPLIYEKHYHGFTLWLDCHHHGALVSYYAIGADHGNEPRADHFHLDNSVPPACEQYSTASYRTASVDPSSGTWDRGHLVPANQMDATPEEMSDSFSMTNVLPQQSRFNEKGGAWYYTEELTECYREITPLQIWSGVIWGHDRRNDYFVSSHGIATPDYWWKLVYREDNHAYLAWIFPNDKSARAGDIDQYLVSIAELKKRLQYVPDFGPAERLPSANTTPAHTWKVLSSGDTLTCEGHSTSGS